MIGVLAPETENWVISEFFELFKTPWEFFRSDRTYDVILSVGDVSCDERSAKLIVHYASCRLRMDAEEGIEVTVHNTRDLISQDGSSLVIYDGHLSFRDSGKGTDVEPRVADRFSYRSERDGFRIERIGYDLFAEISHLLTIGQPEEFAQFPTVDLHIALLRDLIITSGCELLEIPPVPEGYGCIACLTHDIDHPAIKFHKWDFTALGFLYRATAGSVASLVRGRLTFGDLVKNWIAAAKLPLVYIGLAKDFWSGFEDRYSDVEDGIPSTYFVVPFGKNPGSKLDDPAPRRRATGYGAKDIKDALLKIKANGCEVAVHGIDAWWDSDLGRRELEEIRNVTGGKDLGVRMHWLFFDEESPKLLEEAGAAYDSTIGYRSTVGFRSGTTQVFKPRLTDRLLELPLHVMDTALFYPAYANLSPKNACCLLRELVNQVAALGGCVTVNWHDRSLASERLWGASYADLLEQLKSCGAWFATASESVAWFRKRRSVVFRTDGLDEDAGSMTGEACEKLPGLLLRVHNTGKNVEEAATHFVDIPFPGVRQGVSELRDHCT